MLAREQLRFLTTLAAELDRPTRTAVTLQLVQANFIAVICMLRSIGHVFAKVDCDTPDKKKWSKEAWFRWSKEPIFSEFIDPTRNALLKEFRGGLSIRSGFDWAPIYADPHTPSGVTTAVTFDPENLRDAHDEPVMPKIRGALEFWEKCIREAETAFGGMKP